MEYLDEKIDPTKNVLIYPKTLNLKIDTSDGFLKISYQKIFFNLKLREIKNKIY